MIIMIIVIIINIINIIIIIITIISGFIIIIVKFSCRYLYNVKNMPTVILKLTQNHAIAGSFYNSTDPTTLSTSTHKQRPTPKQFKFPAPSPAHKL